MNSLESLSASCDVKVCSNLNPSTILDSGGAAVVVGAPVVITGCVDVPMTGGEVTLPKSMLDMNWYQIVQVCNYVRSINCYRDILSVGDWHYLAVTWWTLVGPWLC